MNPQLQKRLTVNNIAWQVIRPHPSGLTPISFEAHWEWALVVCCTGPKESDMCNNCPSTMLIGLVVLSFLLVKLSYPHRTLAESVATCDRDLVDLITEYAYLKGTVTAEKSKSFKVLMDNEVVAVKMHKDEVNVMEDQIIKL
ncbi:hypothetical protein Tco_1250544 [Tanacetum coccineum]